MTSGFQAWKNAACEWRPLWCFAWGQPAEWYYVLAWPAVLCASLAACGTSLTDWHRHMNGQTDAHKVCDILIDCTQCKLIIHQMLLLLSHFCLPSTRQHPSYDDCLEVKREYYQNCSVLDCVTQCSQSVAHFYEQFLQVQQIGFVTLGPLCCL